MYYIFLHSFYGTELIATARSLEAAKKYQAEREANWEPGFLWSIQISPIKLKEVNYFN